MEDYMPLLSILGAGVQNAGNSLTGGRAGSGVDMSKMMELMKLFQSLQGAGQPQQPGAINPQQLDMKNPLATLGMMSGGGAPITR